MATFFAVCYLILLGWSIGGTAADGAIWLYNSQIPDQRVVIVDGEQLPYDPTQAPPTPAGIDPYAPQATPTQEVVEMDFPPTPDYAAIEAARQAEAQRQAEAARVAEEQRLAQIDAINQGLWDRFLSVLGADRLFCPLPPGSPITEGAVDGCVIPWITQNYSAWEKKSEHTAFVADVAFDGYGGGSQPTWDLGLFGDAMANIATYEIPISQEQRDWESVAAPFLAALGADTRMCPLSGPYWISREWIDKCVRAALSRPDSWAARLPTAARDAAVTELAYAAWGGYRTTPPSWDLEEFQKKLESEKLWAGPQ